jgi:hypothetical protein
MAGSASSLLQSTSHVHLNSEVCPWCEQAISHDKFEEISARIAEEERARLAEHEAKLRDQFALERQSIAAKAQSEIDAAKRNADDAVLKVRQEAEAKAAELAVETAEKLLAAVALGKLEAESAMAERVKLAEANAEQASKDRLAAQTALKSLEESFATQTAKADEDHKASLVAAVASAEAEVTERLKGEMDAAVAKAAAAETAKVEAERQAQERVITAEQKSTALKQQLDESNAAHQAELAERVNEVREALGKEMTKAILDSQATWFAEKQKLIETADHFKRQLEKRTAAELGEGAEINLFEALKEAFDSDAIRRVPKGENGADIIHDIVENGVACGTIVYDSKNRNAWQSSFAVKLHGDMIAAEANHAILSTNKFPAGAKQLHLQDGVIIACPARVVALVQMLRAHIVQTHGLRLSSEQREEKTAALYDYITSERCTQLMDSLQTSFEKLGEIDVDEQKAHQTVWAKRGRILKEVEKMRGTFVFELNRIIGTAEAAE